MEDYAAQYIPHRFQSILPTFEQLRQINLQNFHHQLHQSLLAPTHQFMDDSFSVSESNSTFPSQYTSATPAKYSQDSPWIERKISTEKYQLTRGTPLTLNSLESSQSSQNSFNIARNIFEDYSQGSDFSQSEVDLGPVEPTYSMVKLGLKRKAVQPNGRVRSHRYPSRNKTSPVRWWMGERAVYNDEGFLIGKDLRR